MPAERLPDFVVIGAQKSGSTLLADRIGSIDGVHVPRLEIPYFESPFFGNSDLDELKKSAGDIGTGTLFGIKRADYLARPEVPGNLAQVVPAARLIAVLRPPVDRAVSAAYWYMLHGFTPIEDVNTLLGRLLDRRPALESGAVAPERPDEILSYGQYGRALDRWLAHFPQRQLVVVDSRRVDDPATYRTIATALEVGGGDRWPTSPLSERDNRGVYNRHRLRLLRIRRHLVYDWSKDDRFTYRRRPSSYRPVRSLLAAVPTLLDDHVLQRLLPNEPQPLTPGVRDRLSSFYSDDIDRTRAIVGIDLNAPVSVETGRSE